MKKIKLTDYIKKSGEQYALSESERTHMEQVLLEYMHVKPLRHIPMDRQKPLLHAWLSVYAFSRRSVALVLVGVLLLSGTGASYAAETALPGDILYPLKTQVNEPLVAALSVSSEAKAEWNIKRAERRLEETAQLASENKLSPETEATLALAFDMHADAAAEGIQKLEDDESPAAMEVASSFETRLTAHETVLANVEEGRDTAFVQDHVRAKVVALSNKMRAKAEKGTAASLAGASAPDPTATFMAVSETAPPDVASAKVSDAAASRMTASETSSVEEAPVKKSTAKQIGSSAKKQFENASKIFGKVKGKLDADALARVEAELSANKALLDEGNQFYSAEEFAKALRAFRESLATSEELAVFLKAFRTSRITTIPATRNSLRIEVLSDNQKDVKNSTSEGEHEDHKEEIKKEEERQSTTRPKVDR